jgi:hypothetical protein
MNCYKHPIVYHPSSKLRWINDHERIIIVDERSESSYELEGLQAAIWDWLTFSPSHRQLVSYLVALSALPEDEAESTLLKIIADWHQDNLLIMEEVTNGG